MNYKRFTPYIEQSILDITINDDEENEALMFLREPTHFRPFSEGIRMLMERNNYPANADELIKRMQAIGCKVTPSTINDWFAGKRRPGLVSNSRTLMYQIAFALSLPLSEIKWFFHHVYYDRCFNCHIPEEAVYYFCFSHNLSYQTACNLLNKVTAILETAAIAALLPLAKDTDNVCNCENETTSDMDEHKAQPYTQFYTIAIRNQIDQLQTSEELLAYFKQNSAIFTNLHTSALEQITIMLEEIKGSSESIEIVKNMRDRNCYTMEEIGKCGLIIRELYYRASHPVWDSYLDDIEAGNLKQRNSNSFISASEIAQYMKDSITKYQINSIDFILNNILSTTHGLSKETNVPELVKLNFPSNKVLSNVLKNNTKASYDAIRKVLVLLHFYIFWCKQLLEPVTDFTAEQHLMVYREEANYMLSQCCYEELYAGNPYDWVFLTCACSEDPLSKLRELVGEMPE